MSSWRVSRSQRKISPRDSQTGKISWNPIYRKNTKPITISMKRNWKSWNYYNFKTNNGTMTKPYNSDILYNYIRDAKKTLRILITKKCNLNCRYCYEEGIVNSTNKSLQNLDLEDFKNIIHAAKKLGVYRISFSGWEPTIYSSWIDELIGLCVSLDIICTITTNGTSTGIITLAKKYPSLKIRVSLDFSNPKDYLYYKGIDCFSVIIKNLKEMVKLKNQININRIVFSLDNERTKFNEMIDFLIKNKLNRKNVLLKLLPSYPHNTFKKLSANKLIKYYEKNWISFDERMDFLRNKSKPYSKYRDMNIAVQTRGIYSPKCCVKNKARCVEGIGSIRINPDGIMQPCFGVRLGQINHKDKATTILEKLKKNHEFLDDLYVKNCHIDNKLLNA